MQLSYVLYRSIKCTLNERSAAVTLSENHQFFSHSGFRQSSFLKCWQKFHWILECKCPLSKRIGKWFQFLVTWLALFLCDTRAEQRKSRMRLYSPKYRKEQTYTFLVFFSSSSVNDSPPNQWFFKMLFGPSSTSLIHTEWNVFKAKITTMLHTHCLDLPPPPQKKKKIGGGGQYFPCYYFCARHIYQDEYLWSLVGIFCTKPLPGCHSLQAFISRCFPWWLVALRCINISFTWVPWFDSCSIRGFSLPHLNFNQISEFQP